MTLRDVVGLTLEAVTAHRLRYGLSALAIAVGVAAVVLMSSVGEGTRRAIEGQVAQFGTTLIGVHAGRVQTSGVPGGIGSASKLTLDDARALGRVPGVEAVTPVAYGTARVEHRERGRRVIVYGVGSDMPRVWTLGVALGRFLPETDWDRGSAVVVLGPRLRRELFGSANPLGATVRVGGSRFRVIGVTAPLGSLLGMDLDDTAYIPVANALRLFDLSELNEVNLRAASLERVAGVVERSRRLMIQRHRGRDDTTIVSQKDAMATVNRVLNVIAGVVVGIAAISLVVGAIGILTIMWIVVHERVAEIGLVKALGARRGQILAWYLSEAAATSLAGGVAGLALGLGGAAILDRVVPGLETHASAGIVGIAVATAITVGVLAGIAPALRAARLDPIEALRGE